MSGINPETYGSVGPWQRYVAKERAARGAYLATVESAHREYLTGPWPQRDYYQQVEQTAWATYYTAGRDAWRHYTAEITPPPPPQLAPTGDSVSFRPGGYLPDADGPRPVHPEFHPYPESDR